MTQLKRRWSDRDRHFGPFLVARHDGHGSGMNAVVLNSGSNEEDDDNGCHLRLQLLGHTLIIELPAIIKPYRRKVKATYWSAETIAEQGRDWYYEEDAREYGFSLRDGFLQVFYGRQTCDSTTTQDWSMFLPWTEWRLVEHNIYDKNGVIFFTDTKIPSLQVVEQYRDKIHRVFTFDDIDGEGIQATTCIRENVYRRGEWWFKWLGYLFKPNIHRGLNIEYSTEVGPEKGSYEGGVLGTSIRMLPGETHEDAFKRHAEKHQLTNITSL